MIAQNTCAFLYWDGNTANTPFKAGVTPGTEGMALVTGGFASYQTVVAIPKGSTKIYIHATVGGVATGWKVLTIT
jgi:hypothetical protein